MKGRLQPAFFYGILQKSSCTPCASKHEYCHILIVVFYFNLGKIIIY